MARKRDRLQREQIQNLVTRVLDGNGPPLIGVSYERVSTKRQVGNTSLETQQIDIDRWATDHHITLVERYIDGGRSGRTDKRAEYQRMMRELVSLQVQVVLVWKLDRFARNQLLQLSEIEKFNAMGVLLVGITDFADYTTAMGKQMLSMNAAQAEWISNMTSERVQRALKHTAEAGRWVGPVPIGYERTQPGGPLIPSSDAPAIHLAFSLYATRLYSHIMVADALNERGYGALDRDGQRRPFGRESIRTILKNRAYIGMVASGGKEYTGNHAPIVDGELFEECQAIMKERAKSCGSPIKAECPGWLITLTYCDHCKRKIWHQLGGRTGATRYYCCSGYSNRTCDQRLIPAPALEEQVERYINGIVLPPVILNDILMEARTIASSLLQQLDRPQADPAELERKRGRLARLYRDGMIDDAEYEREVGAIRLLHEQSIAQPAALQFNEERARNLVANVAAIFQAATANERRAILAGLFESIWVKDRQLSQLTPRPDWYPLLVSIERVLYGVADGYPLPHTIPRPGIRKPLIYTAVVQ